MARVKGAMMTRKRRNATLKLAKGYWGSKSTHYKMANQAVMKSLTYAYAGRKQKKRDFRKLWITRISAGCKMNGMNYSTFMHGLKLAGIDMNRKMLSETAIHDPAAFTALCDMAKKQKRVTAKEKAADSETSEKFAFRCFLLRLGFLGLGGLLGKLLSLCCRCLRFGVGLLSLCGGRLGLLGCFDGLFFRLLFRRVVEGLGRFVSGILCLHRGILCGLGLLGEGFQTAAVGWFGL